MIKHSGFLVVISLLLSTQVLAQTWNIEIVDSEGSVGRFNSIAIDDQDYPHISYYDWTNHDLRYASWNGSDWELETVDSIGMVGRYSSLVLDSSGQPRIAFFDFPYGGLKYASWNGSSWDIEHVDPACNNACISLVLDTQELPHISYSYPSASLKLMHAYRVGPSWEIETIVQTSTYSTSTSLAIDDYNNPHVSYLDNEGLMLASFNGSTWETQVIDSCGGFYFSLELDSQGNPCIAYVDVSDFWSPTLKYAQWSGSSWIVQSVRKLIAPTGYASLALDSDDNPHISYTYAWRNTLTYTYWTGSEWISCDVDTIGNIDYDTSIELDSFDNPHFSYFDMDMNDLRYACRNTSGISDEPSQSGCSLISVSPNPSRGALLVSFSLPEASQVSFSLFDATGRLVQNVHSGCFPAGISSVTFEQLATGLFFCRMTAGEFSTIHRFVVIQ